GPEPGAPGGEGLPLLGPGRRAGQRQAGPGGRGSGVRLLLRACRPPARRRGRSGARVARGRHERGEARRRQALPGAAGGARLVRAAHGHRRRHAARGRRLRQRPLRHALARGGAGRRRVAAVHRQDDRARGQAAARGPRRGSGSLITGGAGHHVKVVIAEDQAMVRGALAALLELEGDIEVVAQASDGDEALALVKEHKPDVLVTDIEMPGTTGLELAASVAELRHRGELATKVVILTTFARAGYLRRALDAGATGYLLKDAPASQLADALRRVMAGGR